MLRSIGREAECGDRHVSFGLNQLYGGQEKFLLVEVEIPAAKADEVRTLARARARYAVAAGGSTVELRAEGQVRYTRDQERVKREANQQVQTEYAANAIAEARREAIVRSDAGDSAGAAAVLRQRSEELGLKAASFANAPMAQVAEAARKEAAEVEAKGIDNERRKAMSAESFKTRNQQRE